MRKFTLYQASRLTKISRYKLEQAIRDGILKSTDGRGNVKCFIMEDELDNFVNNYGEEYKRFTYPDENDRSFNTEEMNQYVSKDLHNQLMNEKDRVIRLLEMQNEQLMPFRNNGVNDKPTIKIDEIKAIALSAIDQLPSSKAQLKSQLSEKLSGI